MSEVIAENAEVIQMKFFTADSRPLNYLITITTTTTIQTISINTIAIMLTSLPLPLPVCCSVLSRCTVQWVYLSFLLKTGLCHCCWK